MPGHTLLPLVWAAAIYGPALGGSEFFERRDPGSGCLPGVPTAFCAAHKKEFPFYEAVPNVCSEHPFG